VSYYVFFSYVLVLVVGYFILIDRHNSGELIGLKRVLFWVLLEIFSPVVVAFSAIVLLMFVLICIVPKILNRIFKHEK
jgi:hypothetical protein